MNCLDARKKGQTIYLKSKLMKSQFWNSVVDYFEIHGLDLDIASINTNTDFQFHSVKYSTTIMENEPFFKIVYKINPIYYLDLKSIFKFYAQQ